jgi:hypothetical protein
MDLRRIATVVAAGSSGVSDGMGKHDLDEGPIAPRRDLLQHLLEFLTGDEATAYGYAGEQVARIEGGHIVVDDAGSGVYRFKLELVSFEPTE